MKECVFISSWSLQVPPPATCGIGQYEFNTDTGELTPIRVFKDMPKLSVSCIDASRNILYVLDESCDLPSFGVGGGGSVYAFKLDPETGNSVQISCEPTMSPYPAYLSLDTAGKYLVVANHATHSYITKVRQDDAGDYYPTVEFDDSLVTLFAINEDGSIGKVLDVAKHTGRGPSERQRNPHPHSAMMSPSGNLFAVCDKGNDGVYMYKIDRENNKLVASEPYMAKPGSMPRYCVFHPTKPFFYHNNESNMFVSAYTYDEDGKLTSIGDFCALEEECAAEQQGLTMHPSGKYLFDILKVPKMVAMYEIDPENGSLTLKQNYPLPYEWPRGSTLSPDGRFLLISCALGDKVVVLSVGEDGILSPTGIEQKHTGAAHVTFWKP